ncbi:hypothetical protein MKW94_024713 [Papaver nudicaule]|uniref:Amidase domain-containing protein n=1 Tax=Papaver nudicaule TaxID=74823 RepID=A0AA41RN41_PAPNU|nr:hypothetical protein [Papaver nudicaule]
MVVPFSKLLLLISISASLFIVNCSHGFSIKDPTYPAYPTRVDKADCERKSSTFRSSRGLNGILSLLKDSIATKDKLSTTAGSFALLTTMKVRRSGALIMGKASLSEWSNYCGIGIPSGWSGRSRQVKVQPYVLSRDLCGSSSGPALSVAIYLVTVSKSVVGIKPTVELTSRAGVIPISPKQDMARPVCRTVSDDVYVLDAIVSRDPNKSFATCSEAKLIPIVLEINNFLMILNPCKIGELIAMLSVFAEMANVYGTNIRKEADKSRGNKVERRQALLHIQNMTVGFASLMIRNNLATPGNMLSSVLALVQKLT